MNISSEQNLNPSAAKIAEEAITQIPLKDVLNTPPLPARGNDEVMSQQEKKS